MTVIEPIKGNAMYPLKSELDKMIDEAISLSGYSLEEVGNMLDEHVSFAEDLFNWHDDLYLVCREGLDLESLVRERVSALLDAKIDSTLVTYISNK